MATADDASKPGALDKLVLSHLLKGEEGGQVCIPIKNIVMIDLLTMCQDDMEKAGNKKGGDESEEDDLYEGEWDEELNERMDDDHEEEV